MESKENSNSSWLDRWRGLGWKYQALAISLILVVIIISITAGVLSSGGNQGMYAGMLQGLKIRGGGRWVWVFHPPFLGVV